MDNQRKPIGQPVLIGKMAYQIYSRVWDGQVRYIAKVGKPYVGKETGLFGIITELEDHTAADFLLAARQAKKELARLAAQAFQQRLQQQQATFSKSRSASEPSNIPPPLPPAETSANGVAKAAEG